MKKDFLTLADCTSQEVHELLQLGLQLKQNPHRSSDLLKGKTLAMIFQKPSNRTRVSFETGIYQLGGKPIYLTPLDIDLGKREPTADVAKTLARYVDGIMARVFAHDDLVELAKHANVPVINALSDLTHPCQALADLLTIQENFRSFKELKMAYIGDGNNVCHSLMIACAKVGLHLVVATPKGYEPDSKFIEIAQQVAKETGVDIYCTTSPEDAIVGANVVYTDTWVSMGQEEEMQKRLNDFDGFQVNKELFDLATDDAIFMHCLPAHRGQEVTEDVIDGPRSVVFDQAENRLHMQKAVMIHLFSFKHS